MHTEYDERRELLVMPYIRFDGGGFMKELI